MADADELRQDLEQAATGRELTVVDLSSVTFVDSTILGVLVGVAKRCRAAGSRLVVIRAAGIVVKAMTVTGLTEASDLTRVPNELEQEIQELVATGDRA